MLLKYLDIVRGRFYISYNKTELGRIQKLRNHLRTLSVVINISHLKIEKSVIGINKKGGGIMS